MGKCYPRILTSKVEDRGCIIFVYLIDDEDVSVNDINSSYCWFKARTMKYRVIPD
jgi:hypothetical protein